MISTNIKIDDISICQKEQALLAISDVKTVQDLFKNLIISNNSCACCGYIPKENQRLKMHVLSIDEKNPSNSICQLLCEACFYIKHFDKAVENDYVVLVNSEYSQADLVRIQRKSTNAINAEIKNKRISVLKQKPSEYLEIIKKDSTQKSLYIKVVFSDKFKENWKKCR